MVAASIALAVGRQSRVNTIANLFRIIIRSLLKSVNYAVHVGVSGVQISKHGVSLPNLKFNLFTGNRYLIRSAEFVGR